MPPCQATRVVARLSRIAPLGATRLPQALTGSAVRAAAPNVARIAAEKSLRTIGTSLVSGVLVPKTRPSRKSSRPPLPGPHRFLGEGVLRLEDLHLDRARLPGEALGVRRSAHHRAVVEHEEAVMHGYCQLGLDRLGQPGGLADVHREVVAADGQEGDVGLDLV